MFKNATLFKIVTMPGDMLAVSLDAQQFTPCGASQEKSVGWVPPRGESHGALLEHSNNQRILKLMIETRSVPGDVVKRKVADQLADIEVQTGRKPGKKEKREITEDARMALLPMAFSKLSATFVWVNPATGHLVIGSTSRAIIDQVTTALIKSFDGMALQQISTNTSPAAAMSQWLATVTPPWSFNVDRECELKAADESKAVVKYGRHALDTVEVQAHIKSGKVPTKLALTWSDRVSFVLTDNLQLKKIAFLESVFEGNKDGDADQFDADVAILTGELRKLIPDLLDALGGEVSNDPFV